nr:uncharacterized protein LOC117605749 isoform X1 [Osmia lignaria]
MPKLNKLLVTSIIADIRECVCVANEIYSWVGGIEHLSWKFPTKIARDINAMEIVKEYEGTAGEFYILLLELAYDRIQFLLRLIVEFLDKYPFIDDFFKEVTCVNRPNQISLANLLRLVWDRLKTIPESISRQMVKNSQKEAEECFTPKVSRSCQAGGSMNYCESCRIAGETILQAINTIEEIFVENKLISVAAAQRNECKSNLIERTQWSVMSKLTKAIGEDIEMALKKMRNSNLKIEAVKREHEKSIRELQSNLTTQKKRVDTLQVKNLELENALENGRFPASGTGTGADETNRCNVETRKRDVEGNNGGFKATDIESDRRK